MEISQERLKEIIEESYYDAILSLFTADFAFKVTTIFLLAITTILPFLSEFVQDRIRQQLYKKEEKK